MTVKGWNKQTNLCIGIDKIDLLVVLLTYSHQITFSFQSALSVSVFEKKKYQANFFILWAEPWQHFWLLLIIFSR